MVDDEYLSVALQNALVCLEMPLFSIAHIYAFSYQDYVQASDRLAGRMPFWYAVRDSFGILDVQSDMLATFYGTGYQDWVEQEQTPLVREHRGMPSLWSRHARRRDRQIGRTSEASPLTDHGRQESYSACNDNTLDFQGAALEDEHLYNASRKLSNGDHRYPCIYNGTASDAC